LRTVPFVRSKLLMTLITLINIIGGYKSFFNAVFTEVSEELTTLAQTGS